MIGPRAAELCFDDLTVGVEGFSLKVSVVRTMHVAFGSRTESLQREDRVSTRLREL